MPIERDTRHCGCRTLRWQPDSDGEMRSSDRTGGSIAHDWPGSCSPPELEGRRERACLEQLTHPEIRRLIEQQAAELVAGKAAVAVLDAPLLLEAGWDELCQKIVFVEAPREARLTRAMARGWGENEFAAREGAQESLDWKRERADAIIDNSGPPERTQAQVEQLWASLIR